jgi:hypothetical protein
MVLSVLFQRPLQPRIIGAQSFYHVGGFFENYH